MAVPSSKYEYNVFLCFRGQDSRENFADRLFTALKQKAIRTIRGDLFGNFFGELEGDDGISGRLPEAIGNSRISIVVLSGSYSSYTICLKVLAYIVECMHTKSQIVFPIYYHVDPSDIRMIKGYFGRGFAKHEKNLNIGQEELDSWRSAIQTIAHLRGWDSRSFKDDDLLIEDIVGHVIRCVGSEQFQSTDQLEEDFEATEDAMDQTSQIEPPAPLWKTDVLSGFGMEDTRSRGTFIVHSDHDLQNTGLTGVSKTFEDVDQLEKGVPLPSTSFSSTQPIHQPAVGEKNDEFLGFRGDNTQRGSATHSVHDEIQNTMNPTFTNEDHLERRDSSSSTSTSPHSSTERDPQHKYDVFLSFRGEDTRRGFLAHLYRGLQNTKVIKTFKDDVQLEKGTDIALSLLKAIEDSRFAVIVLSENYASSAWCLDELKKIFECMEGKNTILPIFYDLDPCVVRHQKEDTSFGKAFIKHGTRHDIETINQWRAALKEVASISGWDSKTFPTDIELIEDIVKHLWKKVLQAPTGNFRTFAATRQAIDNVMDVLKNDQFTVIGVHGVAGVGKTTMVKHVAAQAQKDGIFDHVVAVVVSKNPDLQELQGTLTNELRGDRVLIILDDVWENFELSSIGIPSHQELQMCNSKVVVTTRESNVCHSMRCDAQIPVDVLSENDSWKLFKETSGKTFHKSNMSYKEARKVAGECGGLPKAIIAAARSLGDKYLDEWNEAVARAFGDSCLNESNEAAQTVNLEAEDTSDSFEDAYYLLESDDAKSCFLLCCLFPANYDIPIEELLKYGIGIGLFQNDTMLEARDRAHSVVKYLKASRLLLDGTKKGCIKMTDDIRNLALSIGLFKDEGKGFLVKPGCELEQWPEAEARWWQGWPSWFLDPHEVYSTISLMRNKLRTLPEYLVCSELQILLLQSNAGICDIPKTFFQSPNALEVLDLSFTGISSLPPSFNCLTNLQALNLDFCSNLSDVSDLVKLKKLEILSMRGLPLKKFPEQIGNLTSLRMLDVTGIYLETIPSNVISRLYRLEEVHMKFQFGKWGSKIDDAVEETNAQFDELTGLLDLNILEVYISDVACLPESVGHLKPNWVHFDICISKNIDDVIHHEATECFVKSQYMLPQHEGLSRILTLDTMISGLPVWFISVVTEKVEKLEYRNCEDLNDIVGECDHGNLLALKSLSVNGRHKNLKEIINTRARVSNDPIFENLEELHLRGLYSLKELCVGELPPESLRKLKLLKVQTCRSLVNALLPSMLLQRLQNLEEIICVNLEGMKYVFGEGLDPEENS